MKLPRLGDPTTHKYGNIEITIASQFDLMPTWAQWALVSFFVISFGIGIGVLIFYKG